MLKRKPSVPLQSSEPLVRCPAVSGAEGGFGVTCPVWVGQIAIGKNKPLKKKWKLLGIFFCSGTEAIKL